MRPLPQGLPARLLIEVPQGVRPPGGTGRVCPRDGCVLVCRAALCSPVCFALLRASFDHSLLLTAAAAACRCEASLSPPAAPRHAPVEYRRRRAFYQSLSLPCPGPCRCSPRPAHGPRSVPTAPRRARRRRARRWRRPSRAAKTGRAGRGGGAGATAAAMAGGVAEPLVARDHPGQRGPRRGGRAHY